MSGLRCRPGDLAVIVRSQRQELLGLFVDVLYAAPMHDHVLPDGALNQGAPSAGWWVIRLQRPVLVAMESGWQREARYGTVHDTALRPIRPDADEPATETEREKEAA